MSETAVSQNPSHTPISIAINGRFQQSTPNNQRLTAVHHSNFPIKTAYPRGDGGRFQPHRAG